MMQYNELLFLEGNMYKPIKTSIFGFQVLETGYYLKPKLH